MRCPADAIPEHFDVDLTGLEIGDSVHISAIALPEGVQADHDRARLHVATIVGRSAEEAGPAVATAAEAAEPGAEEAAAPAEACWGERQGEEKKKKKKKD